MFGPPQASGTDGARWTLNWKHWIMGLPVPGAVSPVIGGQQSKGISLSEAAAYDIVMLRNGDLVAGIIRDNTLTVETSDATVTLERSATRKIVFKGGAEKTDAVTRTSGAKISGTVQNKVLQFEPAGGEPVALARDRVKAIRFRHEQIGAKR